MKKKIVLITLVGLILGSYVYYEWIWEKWPTERIESEWCKSAKLQDYRNS